MNNKEESRLAEMLPEHIGKLSILERKIASYLLKHEDKITSMDITEIADGAGVSKATVVRFCKALGFQGLKDFKISYESGKKRFPNLPSKLDHKVNVETISSTLTLEFNRVAENTFVQGNTDVIRNIAEDIKKAGSVAVIHKDARILSELFAEKMSSLGIKTTILSEENIAASDTVDHCPIVVIALASDLNGISSYVRKVRLEGRESKIEVISQDEKSWLAVNADNLLVPFEERIVDDDRTLLTRLSVIGMIEQLYLTLKLLHYRRVK